MTNETPYTVPKEPGRWRALTFAALVHVALLVFLWIGVHWQNETPTTIEAEVWSPQPREAAPAPEPVKAPEPKPEPVPKPVVQEPPKPKVVEPPVVKPDIALEQEKRRKAEEKKRLDEERLEKERQAKEKKRLEEEKLAKEKKRREEERLAKLKEQEEAKRITKEKEEKAKKEAAEKKRKQEEEEQMLAKLREENMKRITGAVTGTGGSGDAPTTQGGRASGEYAAKVRAKIKSNTIYIVPDGLGANTPVEYLVELLPDGSLRASPRKLKSSGIAAFDEAVLRAIDKSQPFPRDDKTGAVPSSFIVSHKPKDQ